MVFTPIMITYEFDDERYSDFCISQLKFCSQTNIEDGDDILGKDLVIEQIRQKCIFKQGIKLYFDYMMAFFEQCYYTITLDCSRNVQYQLGIDSDLVQACFDNSFLKIREN